MFLSLWSEISQFHKLIYDIAQGSILIVLDADVGTFPAIKSVIKLDKTVFFLRFCEFIMW